MLHIVSDSLPEADYLSDICRKKHSIICNIPYKVECFWVRIQRDITIRKKGLEEELQQKKISIYVLLKKEGLYLKTHL